MSAKKIIFPLRKQKEIISKVIKIVKPIFKDKSVLRVLIEGSAARKEIGKYVIPKHGIMPYSDIDVLVVADGKVKMPKSFFEDYNLPPFIKKTTKQVCYRYIYKRKIEGKIPLHVHIFNIKAHDKKIALKSGLNVNWLPNKKKAIVIYRRKRESRSLVK